MREFEGKTGDVIDQYVTLLCACQLLQEMGREHPTFWEKHKSNVLETQETLKNIDRIRSAMLEKDPIILPDFLGWFEKWFLQRAKPLEEVPE